MIANAGWLRIVSEKDMTVGMNCGLEAEIVVVDEEQDNEEVKAWINEGEPMSI